MDGSLFANKPTLLLQYRRSRMITAEGSIDNIDPACSQANFRVKSQISSKHQACSNPYVNQKVAFFVFLIVSLPLLDILDDSSS